MSNDKTTPQTAPTELVPPTVVEKQPNALVRGYRKIKNTPPKTAIAVVGGVVLVAAGAALGRKTAPYHVAVVEDEFEPEPLFEVPTSDDQSA